MPELKVSQLTLNTAPPTTSLLLLANGGASERTTIQNAVDAAMPQTQHATDTANPHGTTANQVGAEPQNANIQAHIALTANNPHGITPAMISAEPVLGFVPIDVASKDAVNGVAGLDANQKLVSMPLPADIGGNANRNQSSNAQAIAGTDNTTDMSPLRVKEAVTSYGGKCLQVVGTVITTQSSNALIGNVQTNVGTGTEFSAAITPKGNNSKFLVKVRWFGEVITAWDIMFNVLRDGTRVNETTGASNAGLSMPMISYYAGANDSTTPNTMMLETLDSTGSTAGTPTTFQFVVTAVSAETMWTNRCFTAAAERGTSEIIVMEIAA